METSLTFYYLISRSRYLGIPRSARDDIVDFWLIMGRSGDSQMNV